MRHASTWPFTIPSPYTTGTSVQAEATGMPPAITSACSPDGIGPTMTGCQDRATYTSTSSSARTRFSSMAQRGTFFPGWAELPDSIAAAVAAPAAMRTAVAPSSRSSSR